MEKLEKKQGSIIAILAMVFLFAMIAFVTNLCSPMAVILKNNFSVSESLAQVGNYGNFGAYLLMGIPAGLLIQKFGYKTTALAALVVGIVGLLVQWLSGSVGWSSGTIGFVVYLIGAFVSGLCMCMLNAEAVTEEINWFRLVESSILPQPYAFTSLWVALSAMQLQQRFQTPNLHCL